MGQNNSFINLEQLRVCVQPCPQAGRLASDRHTFHSRRESAARGKSPPMRSNCERRRMPTGSERGLCQVPFWHDIPACLAGRWGQRYPLPDDQQKATPDVFLSACRQCGTRDRLHNVSFRIYQAAEVEAKLPDDIPQNFQPRTNTFDYVKREEMI